MKIFTVHEASGAGAAALARADGLVFVRDGFSIFAVISPVLWFIWHKLWIALLVYITGVGVLMGFAELAGLGETQFGILSALINLGIGLEANNIRRWFLEREGAAMIGVVSGHDLEECEYRFFSSWDENFETKGLVERLETA